MERKYLRCNLSKRILWVILLDVFTADWKEFGHIDAFDFQRDINPVANVYIPALRRISRGCNFTDEDLQANGIIEEIESSTIVDDFRTQVFRSRPLPKEVSRRRLPFIVLISIPVDFWQIKCESSLRCLHRPRIQFRSVKFARRRSQNSLWCYHRWTVGTVLPRAG